MKTNMDIRQYITDNADKIIKNNQKASLGYCDLILSLTQKKSISQLPILFDYLNIYRYLHIENDSDLKLGFMKIYNTISMMFSPSIRY